MWNWWACSGAEARHEDHSHLPRQQLGEPSSTRSQASRQLSRAYPALSQPAGGGVGRARRADRRAVGRPFRALRAAARHRSSSRWRCAITGISSRPTIRTSATGAASCSRSSQDDAGRLLDLGTKGSGRTPWSRMGDGRLTLKGGVREVLATSMLEALGVDTSKSLSLIETGEELERHDEPSPTRGERAGAAVAQPYPHRHVPAAGVSQHDTENLKRLLDYSLRTYFGTDGGNAPAETLLRETARARGGDRRRHHRGGVRAWRAQLATTSTSPARASTTARGGSCRPTIRPSPPPISTAAGSMPSAASPTRWRGT